MSAEEDTELRDLVAQSLESKGVLGKIRAQLRASVFLALEEQDGAENKIPLSNPSLKKFLNTTEGRLVTGLVREYLEFFDLDFSIAVFDPESNFSDKYQGRNNLANELNLNDTDTVTSKPLLVEIVRRMLTGGTNTAAVKPLPLSIDTQPQVKNTSGITSPRQNGPISPRSTSPSSVGKVGDDDDFMFSAGFESDDNVKPSRIPQRIKDDKSSKSDASHSHASENDSFLDKLDLKERSLSDSRKDRSGRGSPDRTIGSDDDDDDIFADFPKKSKPIVKKDNDADKRGMLDHDTGPKSTGGLSSLKGAPPLSAGGLGSLKGVPPLPGTTTTTKEIPTSPDWNDLLEIDNRISKLGFDIPGEEKSTHSQDYNDDYEDDFQATSSHVSDQSVSIIEEIEEQLSSYHSGSGDVDDLLTTDHTVSRASDSGLDYAEDILGDF